MSVQLKKAIYSSFGSDMRYYTVVPHFDLTYGASVTSSWTELEQPRKRFVIWERAEDSDWKVLFECDVLTDADDELQALNALFARHGIPLELKQELLYGPQLPVV